MQTVVELQCEKRTELKDTRALSVKDKNLPNLLKTRMFEVSGCSSRILKIIITHNA